MAPLDLGDIWHHSALLGAGFSNNWGGYLAGEMWGAMLGDDLLERNTSLRRLLLEEPDFEVALAEVRSRPDKYTDADRAAFETVVRNAFELHDLNLRHKLGDIDAAVPLWHGFYEMMLRPLVEAPKERDTRTFLFTLNQDLFTNGPFAVVTPRRRGCRQSHGRSSPTLQPHGSPRPLENGTSIQLIPRRTSRASRRDHSQMLSSAPVR
jgi:hypothetical protein